MTIHPRQHYRNQQRELAAAITLVKRASRESVATAELLAYIDREKVVNLDLHLSDLRRKFRHWHIALCEVRGRSRDQIEVPAKNNKLSEKREKIVARLKLAIQERFELYKQHKAKEEQCVSTAV